MEDSNAAFFVVYENAGVRAVVEPEGLTQGEARRGLEAACFQSSEAAFAEVMETGELRVFDSLLSGPSSDFSVLTMLGFTSVVAAPVQYEGQTVGLLALFDVEGQKFAAHDANLLPVRCAQTSGFMRAIEIRSECAHRNKMANSSI